MHEILHLHLDIVAEIVFTTLESLIPVRFEEVGQGPFVLSGPRFGDVGQNDRFQALFVVANEILMSQVLHIPSVNSISLLIQAQVEPVG